MESSCQIGILQVDLVRPELQAQFGDYPQMFSELLGRANLTIRTRIYRVVDGELPAQIDECTGYLITGSRHSVYDDLPWIPPLVDFVGKLLTHKRKLVGVCFGHQFVAHYFGGRVERAEQGWGVGVHESRVLQATQQRDWPWLDQASTTALLCSHRDQVVELPENAELYLASDFCPYGGYVIGDFVLTIQGHPEFSKPYIEALMGTRRELLGEDVLRQALSSLQQPVDAERVGLWFAKFLCSTTRCSTPNPSVDHPV